MTLRLSSGFVDALLQNPGYPHAAFIGNTGDFNDNGGSADTITRDAGSWIDDGFRLGDYISVFGATTAGNNVNQKKLVGVSALTLTLATGTLAATEATIAGTCVVVARGGSLNDILKFGYMKIFTGTQPGSADDVETGSLLVTITDTSGAHTVELGTNGLQFNDDAANNKLSKLSTQTWSGVPVLSNNAGWFRFYDRNGVEGASSTEIRFDGACGLTLAQLNLATLAIQSDVEFLINGFDITLPAA
jgi:hypothetical protein